MARYIDADKLKEDVMSKSSHLLCEWDTAGVLAVIDRQETADVRPERHERWKGFPDNAYIGSDEFGEPKFKEVTIWHCSYAHGHDKGSERTGRKSFVHSSAESGLQAD